MVLDTQPSADVTVTISGHDGTDVSVTPSTLTFTSESWGTAQTVTVSAAQDDDAATDEAVTLSHAVSGTGEYASVTAESVTVTITENDAARVSIDPTESLTVTEGDATGASYTVVLDSQPTADVTIDRQRTRRHRCDSGQDQPDLHVRELGDAPDGHRQRGPGRRRGRRTRP